MELINFYELYANYEYYFILISNTFGQGHVHQFLEFFKVFRQRVWEQSDAWKELSKSTSTTIFWISPLLLKFCHHYTTLAPGDYVN